MSDLWRVGVDNRHKDTLWRLSVQGVPNAGGHGLGPRHPCPCGWVCPAPAAAPAAGPDSPSWLAQRHFFWECPVAQAVVHAVSLVLQRALPDWAGPLACCHVWLLQPPHAGVHAGVWSLVCSAAVAAMDVGRRRAIALLLNERRAAEAAAQATAAGPGLRQALIPDFFPVPAPQAVDEAAVGSDLEQSPPPPDPAQQAGGAGALPVFARLRQGQGVDDLPAPVRRACRAAVADLVGRLLDIPKFCERFPRSWCRGDGSGVSADHPFIGLDPGPPEPSLQSTLSDALLAPLFGAV